MKLRLILIGLALAVLATGAVWAQEEETYPSLGDWDGIFAQPEVSGVFNPMEITVGDVAWDGSGSVDIPFTLNQRATAWVAIYEKGNTETGATGPVGAWLRLEPQDKFVALTPEKTCDVGQNTITWDGKDWEGNAAGAGQYEFDLVAVNNLDKAVLAGPGAGTGFAYNLIDTRLDPPDIWMQEYDREAPPYTAGDVIHGTMGTDYIANPTAWERWSYTDVYGVAGVRSRGGMSLDDESTEIFWTTNQSGEFGGIYKMIINRPAKSWDRDTSFGDNGFARNKEDAIRVVRPWAPLGIVYAAHDSKGEVPFPSIESWDKNSGEITREFDLSDVYIRIDVDEQGREVAKGTGPGNIAVNAHGVWASSFGAPEIGGLNHQGDLLWVNRNGDYRGDKISDQAAAALGMPHGGSISTNMQTQAHGKMLFMGSYNNERGAKFSGFGRDGAGLMDVIMSPTLGPVKPILGWYLTILNEDGPYDGAYTSGHYRMESRAFDSPEEGKWGPGALMYIPLDVESRGLGVDVTVVEEVESAGTPDSYSLGEAYPNPFNPETTIEFSLPVDEHVKIGVYNTAGQLIASLADEALSAGAYKTTWDARDQSGELVSSGVYFYRMQAGDFMATHSMTLLK